MIDDRLRVPQDPEYFNAVGLAVVAFARLEWNAVWCCHRLRPNYIATIEPAKKTAGVIGKDLKSLFLRITDETIREKAVRFADEFRGIVTDRNALMHGKPATAVNGAQMLFWNGNELSISMVDEFSDRCVIAGRNLNAFLHNELAEPCSVVLKK